MKKKFVYEFEEVDMTMKELCDGKGANLGQMVKIGLPIPPGFTITTEACTYYYEKEKCISSEIREEILLHLDKLEKKLEKKFGSTTNPLLVSVRSGARVSMPGMMDTILNLGLNDEVVDGIISITNNPRFAYDSYRRFIQMYSDVVEGVSKKKFEELIDDMKHADSIESDLELTVDNLKTLIKQFKQLYKHEKKKDFPSDPLEQLFGAINAVFESWDNPRANIYRQMEGIPFSWGTAVNVQSMVYGNMSMTSGTGVAFTRNPSTGENKLYGEYLINAQGEDVVAGIRTPVPIAQLEKELPVAYNEFVKTSKILENHYKDMQDIEFTIENEKLYLLQTRNGKRTAQAAIKIATDMVKSGENTIEQALLKLNANQLNDLLHPTFETKTLKKAVPIGQGLAASPGAACGKVVFSVKEAIELNEKQQASILVRLETSPEDIEGMKVASGFLTARGGMTSHAAVVARGMGKCCVSGCKELEIHEESQFFMLNGNKIIKGDYISLDGTSGYIYNEKLPTQNAELSEDFKTVMNWANKYRRLQVRANADTPEDAIKAKEFGAEGIGLCRTEHMFFDPQRIITMREMIVATSTELRKKALEKLLPMQMKDFEMLYEEMGNLPVTIRYLDPPLHEFLPSEDKDIMNLAHELNCSKESLIEIMNSLKESNPMMGHRGCRLAISYPELAIMQTKAVVQAYVNVKKRNPNYNNPPEIMIPLVGDVKEFEFIKKIVEDSALKILKENNMDIKFKIGTMIEIPRAALKADEIAKCADFFSFGTNDLTQMTFGFSRDDAASFLPFYYQTKIYEFDPFTTIDKKGVGKLVELACENGKKTNPNIKLGICGEHGGDAASVEFFHNIGLHYVSCSPYRIPIAILAAAQAAIKENKAKKK